MKYEVTVSVKKTYEIEADDIAQAVNAGLDTFKGDSDVPYSVSAMACDSLWKSISQAVDDSFDREDYYTPEQAAYRSGVSLNVLAEIILTTPHKGCCAGMLAYLKEFWYNMTENMQADVRQPLCGVVLG